MLHEKREDDFRRKVASNLGVSLVELDSLAWEYDANASDDGLIYGYVITFEPAEDPASRALIDRLTEGKGWVQIGLL